MAEQLSPGAQIWYHEAKKIRHEQSLCRDESFPPRTEWEVLFDELSMARRATRETLRRGSMEPFEHDGIRYQLRVGYQSLAALFLTHGRISPEEITEVTRDIQTDAYRQLHKFLHPEDAVDNIQRGNKK